jgi:hypothetical protein
MLLFGFNRTSQKHQKPVINPTITGKHLKMSTASRENPADF